MKNNEYWVLTVFLVLVIIGGLVILMIPRQSTLVKVATDSAKMIVETMEPIYGSLRGGDQIVIKGSQIPKDSQVLFGDNLGIAPRVSDDGSQIVIDSPPSATSEAVRVTVFGGDYQSVLPMMFFYTQ